MQDNKIFIAKDEERGPLCDIYSIGVFLLIILTRKMPQLVDGICYFSFPLFILVYLFIDALALPSAENIYNMNIAPTLWDLECSDRCKRNLIDLTMDCLATDPANRPQTTGAV
jgi:serine/threonine protein kinase